eukprot:TRINITY_DN2757_c1_g3_i1.p1 TRINITY_DN2757_c1_g3~~TRINITY_DN2757_c1_g3_i1.p1  ORF type:complete len:228 (-),score=21.95 TRINITY_DN2757_c1_g3_i1:38-721(-)
MAASRLSSLFRRSGPPLSTIGAPVLRAKTHPFKISEIAAGAGGEGEKQPRQKDTLSEGGVTTPETQQLMQDMKDAMENVKGGTGLAAPQIGVSKRLFIAKINDVMDDNSLRELPLTYFFNPKVTPEGKDKIFMWESCLSVPDMIGKVERHARVSVNYIDELGRRRILRASGYISGLIQHEFDHLNGVLYVDRLKDMRDLYRHDEFETHCPDNERASCVREGDWMHAL